MRSRLFILLVVAIMLIASSAVTHKKHTHKKHTHKKHTRAKAALKSDTSSVIFSCDGPTQETDWTYSPNFTTISCNNGSFLGPYGSGGSISKTFDTSSSHNGVIISFYVAFIDSWDGELFTVIADGTPVFAALHVDGESTSNTCQNGFKDAYFNATIGFNHSIDSLTLSFTSGLDQDSQDEGWGICDLSIVFSQYYVNSSGGIVEVGVTGSISELIFNCESPVQDESWVYSPTFSTIYCSTGVTYVGGYGADGYISSVMSIPDVHKNIIMSFKLAMIDSWDSEEFTVTADGVTVFTMSHYDVNGPSNTCQNGWNDAYADVQFGFNHNGNYLALEFTSTLDQASYDEAWGICNLSIVATSGNIDSDGNYIGTGTGGSINQTYFICDSPALSEYWSYSPYYQTITCAGNTYLGGFASGDFIKAELSVPDEHNGIIVSFNLALIDSWDEETFEVVADGNAVYSILYDYDDATSNTCQSDYDDSYEDVLFGFNHTASTLTLLFISNLDQVSSDEAWGICDLSIVSSQDYVYANGTVV